MTNRRARVLRSPDGDVHRAVGADVDPDLAALSTLTGHHYLDAFTLEAAGADRWSAEAWVRAMFEDDRPALSRAASSGLLGLLLSRPGPPDRIGDFRIGVRTHHTITAETTSALSTDQVAVGVTATTVTLVTSVRHRVAVSRPLWWLISHLHRRFAPRVLRAAARRHRGTVDREPGRRVR